MPRAKQTLIILYSEHFRFKKRTINAKNAATTLNHLQLPSFILSKRTRQAGKGRAGGDAAHLLLCSPFRGCMVYSPGSAGLVCEGEIVQ